MNLWGANIGNHTLDSYFDLTFLLFSFIKSAFCYDSPNECIIKKYCTVLYCNIFE